MEELGPLDALTEEELKAKIPEIVAVTKKVFADVGVELSPRELEMAVHLIGARVGFDLEVGPHVRKFLEDEPS